MKKNQYKIVTVMLSVLLLFTALAGCGSSSPKVSNDVSTVKTSSGEAASTVPVKPAEPPKFTILFGDLQGTFPDDGGPIRQLIKEKTNVDFEITFVAKADYDTKLNLALASGNPPDYFYVYDGMGKVMQMADSGTIIPLDELINGFGKDINAVVKSNEWHAVKYKDKTYAIPWGYLPGDENSPNVNTLIVRKDWMDKLKIETPTTLDEFKNMLVRFNKEDPGGNGKGKTIAMGAGADPLGSFSPIYGAFGALPTFWNNKDGKLVMGFTTQEFKDAVLYIQQLYTEGLIDSEFPTNTTQKMSNDKMTGGKMGSMYYIANWCNPANAVNAGVTKTGGSLVAIPAPKGSNGLGGYPAVNPVGSSLGVISSECKNPQALMELLNYTASPEGELLVFMGREGTDWEWADASKTHLKSLLADTKAQLELGIGNPHKLVTVNENRDKPQAFFDAMKISASSAIDNPNWNVTAAEAENPTHNDIVKKAVLQVIVQKAPIKVLDDAIAQWYTAGGQKMTEQANSAWQGSK